MSKKELIIAVICAVVAGCGIGGSVAFVLHTMQQQSIASTEAIARLEQSIEEANEKAEQASEEAKKAKTESAAAKKKAKEYKEKLGQLEEEKILEESNSEPIETMIIEKTSTPEPTVVETPEPQMTIVPQEKLDTGEIITEFSDGKCYMGIEGGYSEPGSGRVGITIGNDSVTSAATGKDCYWIQIYASGGAAFHSEYSLTGVWDGNSQSLIYTGTRKDIEVITDGKNINTYENQSGFIRFENSRVFYWTDYGTSNRNRGPFEKFEG